MRANEIGITIEVNQDDGIRVASLDAILDSLIGILKEVEPLHSGGTIQRTDWRLVGASMSSPFTARLGPSKKRVSPGSADAVKLLAAGLVLLNASPLEPPAGFTISALVHAKSLADMLASGEISRITLAPPSGESITITQRISANASELLPGEHRETGSIEGRIETLSMHEGKKCAVWDRLTGARVECSVDDILLEVARDAFGRRVLVSGDIKYGREGKPESIAATGIFVYPNQNMLPQFDDLYRIEV